jgi:hypothetical protein
MDSNDRMGATGTVKSFHHMLVIGAGFNYITMDKDNYPEFSVKGNEKMISFFQKIIKYQNDDPYAFYGPADPNSENFPVDFASGGSLFFVSWPYHIANLRDMRDDFGILPAPKYDAEQKNYYSNTANGELSTLPRTYDPARLENIGILLEAMSFYTHHEIIPVYKEVLLQTKVARDMDSSEMLDIVFNGITYDYGINVWQSHVGNKLMTDIFMPKSEAVVSTLDSIATSLDAQIEKLKTAVEQMP